MATVKTNTDVFEKAWEVLKEQIEGADSVENIDTVSGATYSSSGILEAVKKALEKAINPEYGKEVTPTPTKKPMPEPTSTPKPTSTPMPTQIPTKKPVPTALLWRNLWQVCSPLHWQTNFPHHMSKK